VTVVEGEERRQNNPRPAYHVGRCIASGGVPFPWAALHENARKLGLKKGRKLATTPVEQEKVGLVEDAVLTATVRAGGQAKNKVSPDKEEHINRREKWQKFRGGRGRATRRRNV